MSLRKAWFILPLAAALIALAAYFALRGKGGGESVVSEEAALQEHYAELAQLRADRLPVANERAKAVKAMEGIIEQAKNALAAAGVEKPSDEQLKAEIEGHPEKYPEWKGLYAKVERLNSEYSAKLRETQAAVREQMKRSGVQVPGAPRAKQGK